MPDANLSATLAEIEAEARVNINVRPHDCPAGETGCSAHNALRAAAALEAVLKLADGWEKTAAIAHGKAERALAPQTSALLSGRAQAHQDCAEALREAITAELTGTGKEGSDE